MKKTSISPKGAKDPLSIIDAIFVNKARQRVATGVTGCLGLSLLMMSAIIATTKIEDAYPITKS